MQLEERALELDESEFFEDGEDMSLAGGVQPSQLHTAEAPAIVHAHLHSGESESDDDGIVLESECSSSADADDEVEVELVSRIQSLQSSLENAAPVQEQGEALGTSHNSQVGSLKSFSGTSFKGKRLFGSKGDLAASMVVCSTAPMGMAGRRKVAPVVDKTCTLGTSMPISIPMMQRRNSSADLLETAEAAAWGGRAAPATFVPPHMLHRQESSDFGGLISAPGGELGLSPSTTARREKLLARNVILRSTGFIEVQHSSVIGELLDPVKDQLLGTVAVAGTSAVAVPGMRPDAHATPRSSLTQLLGTSK